jgi:hypothetical protein
MSGLPTPNDVRMSLVIRLNRCDVTVHPVSENNRVPYITVQLWSDRYPAVTVWAPWQAEGWTWGDNYEHSAPADTPSGVLADRVIDSTPALASSRRQRDPELETTPVDLRPWIAYYEHHSSAGTARDYVITNAGSRATFALDYDGTSKPARFETRADALAAAKIAQPFRRRGWSRKAERVTP